MILLVIIWDKSNGNFFILCIFSGNNNIVDSFELVNQVFVDYQFCGMKSCTLFLLCFIRNACDNLYVIQYGDGFVGELCVIIEISVIRNAKNRIRFVCTVRVCLCHLRCLIIIKNMGIHRQCRAIDMESCRPCFGLRLHLFPLRCHGCSAFQVIKPVAGAINPHR